jgi:hypothetical protein
MGQKSTLEQLKFIETQYKLGKKPKEIISLSDMNPRTVRKYISILKKMVICFLRAVAQKLEPVGVLVPRSGRQL